MSRQKKRCVISHTLMDALIRIQVTASLSTKILIAMKLVLRIHATNKEEKSYVQEVRETDVQWTIIALTQAATALPCVTHHHVTEMLESESAIMKGMKMAVIREVIVPSLVTIEQKLKNKKFDVFMGFIIP